MKRMDLSLVDGAPRGADSRLRQRGKRRVNCLESARSVHRFVICNELAGGAESA